jgi:hypothetical protein
MPTAGATCCLRTLGHRKRAPSKVLRATLEMVAVTVPVTVRFASRLFVGAWFGRRVVCHCPHCK